MTVGNSCPRNGYKYCTRAPPDAFGITANFREGKDKAEIMFQQHPLTAGDSQCPQQFMGKTNGSSSNLTSSLVLPTFPTFNIGNGFIEIAALTSLIGSATAQTLALGSKGPAGLVWATMTIFGGMSVVKAAVCAVSPGWVRDSLGLRGKETDEAVGLSLDLDRRGIRYRARAGVARGVECEVNNLDQPVQLARKDLYVLDQRTTCILNAVAEAKPGDELRIYTYRKDPFHADLAAKQSGIDRIGLLLSSAKLIEVFVLWKYDAVMLAGVTLATWLSFFLFGVILHVRGYLIAYSKNVTVADMIIASALPMASSAGGTRKVVLGMPKNERTHLLWKMMWISTSLIFASSVIATYMALGQSIGTDVFLVWTAFQFLWVGLRSTYFHLVEDREKPYVASLKGKPWKDVGFQERTRVRNLVLALAKYQSHVHPRGIWSYEEDFHTMPNLEKVITKFPLTSEVRNTQITVVGVVGDTILSSVFWIYGSKKGGFDFYDTCIVVLSVSGQELAIPAARVMSAKRPKTEVDPEQGSELERPPRGSSNLGTDIEWWFWIPCGEGRWLHFNSEQLKFNGIRRAEILTDDEVTERLAAGALYISLKHVDEVKEIVKTSTEGFMYLSALLA